MSRRLTRAEIRRLSIPAQLEIARLTRANLSLQRDNLNLMIKLDALTSEQSTAEYRNAHFIQDLYNLLGQWQVRHFLDSVKNDQLEREVRDLKGIKIPPVSTYKGEPSKSLYHWFSQN